MGREGHIVHDTKRELHLDPVKVVPGFTIAPTSSFTYLDIIRLFQKKVEKEGDRHLFFFVCVSVILHLECRHFRQWFFFFFLVFYFILFDSEKTEKEITGKKKKKKSTYYLFEGACCLTWLTGRLDISTLILDPVSSPTLGSRHIPATIDHLPSTPKCTSYNTIVHPTEIPPPPTPHDLPPRCFLIKQQTGSPSTFNFGGWYRLPRWTWPR